MATTANHFLLTMLLFVLLIATSLDFTVGQVGLCFGRLGNNLPGVQRTIALYKKYNVTRMRLYDTHPPTLRALSGTNIELMLGVRDDELQDLANCPDAAQTWVANSILRYPNVNFRYIAVGNEIDPASALGPFVLPAMQNIYRAVRAAGRAGQIRVSTSIKTDLLERSYPPRDGRFYCKVNWYIRPILEFLRDTNTPILVNIYPYIAYNKDKKNIDIDYALLQPNSGHTVNGVYYDNLFYAMLDAVHAAIDKIFAAATPLVSPQGEEAGSKQTGNNPGTTVSETGQPSNGGGQKPPPAPPPFTGGGQKKEPDIGLDAVDDGPIATLQNQRIYINNLMRIVRNGTPMRPNQSIETYIFAMYDENLKPGLPYERHFGIFLPSGQPKFPFRFS